MNEADDPSRVNNFILQQLWSAPGLGTQRWIGSQKWCWCLGDAFFPRLIYIRKGGDRDQVLQYIVYYVESGFKVDKVYQLQVTIIVNSGINWYRSSRLNYHMNTFPPITRRVVISVILWSRNEKISTHNQKSHKLPSPSTDLGHLFCHRCWRENNIKNHYTKAEFHMRQGNQS